MSDITQGQDAKPPSDEKPDVDTLFGAKDVDDLFPADYKPTNQPVRNVSPIQDMLFSNPGRAHARILDAFGYGFAQDWGAGQKEFTEADEYLRKAGVYNDYAAGQRNIIKAANEAIMRPAVAAIVAAKSTLGGVFRGAQGAVAQAGEEYGAPNLAHELAAVPEAFPAGFHQPMGVPHVPHDIAHARSLDVIGEGEAGYFGTKPIEAEPAKEATQAAKVQDVAQPEDTPGAASEAPPSPVVQETAPQPEAPTQDIHAVARQIAPETFSEFDALAQKKDTFRRWIDELREVRDQTTRENAPHADEIADLQTKLQDATPRLAKKYNERLAPMIAERDAYIADNTKGDSADMAKIRQQLMQADYRQHDLAPDVAKAYRDAEGRMPQAEGAQPSASTQSTLSADQLRSARAKPETEYHMSAAAIEEPQPYHAFTDMARDLPDEVNDRFQVHGLASGNVDANLLDMLEHGIDAERGFNSGKAKGGTHGVDSTRTYGSPYLILSDADKDIPQTGVKNVVAVGPAEANLPALKKAFPNVNFMTVPEAEAFMKRETPKAAEPEIAKSEEKISAGEGAPVSGAQAQAAVEAKPEAETSDARHDRITKEMHDLPADADPQLRQALNDAGSIFGVSAGTDKAATASKSIDWALKNNRPDIAETIVERAEQAAENARNAKPGVAENSPRFKPIEDRLAADARDQQTFANDLRKSVGQKPEAAAPVAPAVQALPIAHAPSIVADVSQKLKAAGRPTEEADAAAQIVAAYWETRAQRFEGAKGTAAEMYAAEGPEIKAGKEKSSKKARELELAQKGQTLNQSGNGTPRTVASTKLQEGFLRQEWQRNGPELDYEDLPNRIWNKEVAEWNKTHSTDIDRDHYRFGSHPDFEKHFDEKYLAGKKAPWPGVKQANEYFEDRGERGSAVYVEGKVPEEYQQDVKGRIRLREDGRSTITLMKNADASTFIHETGHEWLERMLDDARDTEAPQALRDDARTVLKWLGADSAAAVKTRHHEKFARGFETYMLEGRAPSNALARVFAKFKDWLTTIYRTAAALKAPISDEIRGVFDRMLAEKPEKTVIAPERRTDLGLAETHEGLAEHTPPHHGFKVAGEIRGERDSLATAHALEEDHARLEDARKGIGEHPPGGAESPGNANEAGALAGQAETAGRAGTERAGGGEVAEEGARSRKGAIGLNKAPTPLLNFIASRGGISASEELISDLRQALGGKNHYVPGYGQLIRTPKQISSSAKRAGRFAAMPLDRAREAAVEAGLLPETATVADMLNIIDDEVRGLAPKGERPIDPAEQAHAEHNFLEGLNDKLREAGGHELSDAERTRALELFHKEGLNDPSQIIERLALEQDDLEIERGAPERAEGIPGWDVAAPGWEAAFDDRGDASHPGGSHEGTQPLQPGGATARHGGAAEKLNPFDPNAPLPPSETRLIDKAGNIRLDNLGTPEDVNAVIRATADELAPYNEAITRGHIPDAEVVKLADALGMDASKLSERKLGEAFSAEQIVAARKLLIRSAQGVRDAMALAAEGDEAAVLAYAEAKSRHLMIQEHVSGITAEAGRALRAFRALEGQKDAAVITGFLQDTTGKTLYQLQREAQLGLKLETPQQVSKFVADSAKPTYKDMLIEAWMASLLSGARTHVANVLGNSIASIWHVVETATSAGISKVLGSEDGVLFGEAGAELFGMVQGSREGIAAGIKAFLTEDPQLTATRQAEKPQPKAIPGKFGEIVRTPMRLLGAEDEFFKAVAFRGDIYRQAYSMAAKEGLAPELMRQRTAELAMSPTDDMIASAKKVADYQTFQNALGKTGRAISAFSNSHALAKVVVPFVRTPINLLKYAGERSPLGVFSQEVRDNLSGKNGVRARDTQIARIALGTMVGVTAFSYAAQGVITGGGPADKGKKAVMMANGWQPYSVKVGDMYYSYNRLDPFSVTLGVAADAYEIMTAFGAEHPDKEHLLSLTFAAITKNILNRTALQGISDLNQAASDPDRYFKNYVKGLAGSLVPAISAQSAQAIDPTVREARTIIDNFKARTPFLSQTLHPKRDIWGEPVVREGALGPDIASPIAEARLKNDPVNQALLNAGYYPATLPRKLNGIDLTDQQYDDYARIAGRMAKMRLNAFVNTPGISLMPKQVQADNMRDIVKASREFAQSMIMMQAHGSDNDIMVKASQAKTAKFKQTETVH